MGESGDRRQRLIRSCNLRLAKALKQAIEPGMKQAGDYLVEAAKQNADPTEKADALHGLSRLENNCEAFEARLLKECSASLTPSPAAGDTARAWGAARLPTGEGLSLLDEAALECATARESFVARCETKCGQELYALSSRLGLIMGTRYEDLSKLPVGPGHISAALARATGVLELPGSTSPLFARGFCEALLPALAECYYELNDELAAAGILPNLKYKRINRDWADRARRRDSGAAAQAFFNRPSDTPSDTSEVVSEIRRLMGVVKPTPLGVPDGHRVGPESIDRALAQLQREVAAGKPPAATGEALNQSVLNTISKTEFRGDGVQLDPENSQTLEIMSQLRDFVNRQRMLNQRLATMVNRLQVPLYRVALNNKELLHSGAHPARRFLNVLADTGNHWTDRDKADHRMLRNMEMVVDRAVNEYRGDDEIFDELFEDLSSQIETADQRALIRQKRSIEAAEGIERLRKARKKARRFIDLIIEKYQLDEQPMPQEFLKKAWFDYLCLLLVRSDCNNTKEYKYACLAAQTLAYHNRPKLSSDQMRTLVGRRKALKKLTLKAMVQIGWSVAERTAAWDGLAAWMDVRLANRQAASRLGVSLPDSGHFGESLRNKDFPLPHLNEVQRAELARLQTVPFGTWFEFHEENALRKLAWYSTLSSHVLFVNNLGIRSLESTLHDLAILVEANQAGIYVPPAKPMFDRALDAIQSGLSQLARNLSGGPGLNPSPA